MSFVEVRVTRACCQMKEKQNESSFVPFNELSCVKCLRLVCFTGPSQIMWIAAANKRFAAYRYRYLLNSEVLFGFEPSRIDGVTL